MNKLYLRTECNQRYLWFENNHNNYELIKSYYPRFYDRIYEMQEILKAQGKVLDAAEIAFEIVLNNMFINYMDYDAVASLEEFLSIIPASNQTLDDRKKVLTAHFRGYGKISASIIKETSSSYNLEAETFFDEQDENSNFLLRIKLKVPRCSDSVSDYVENVRILDIRLPAHLKKFYDIVFETDSKIGLAQISVFRLHFNQTSEEIDFSTAPVWFVDDDGNMLLDDDGNILIEERSGADVSTIETY